VHDWASLSVRRRIGQLRQGAAPRMRFLHRLDSCGRRGARVRYKGAMDPVDLTPPYELVFVESRAQWREWLAECHHASPGVWVVTWKTATVRPSVPMSDIAEEAVCFGWVDSRPARLDDERSRILVTPRKAKSSWSRINKERAARLIDQGMMMPAGRAAIDAAKANGAWNALDDVENLVEPDDLRDALDAVPDARRYWNAFPRSTRRAILEWIASAKRSTTRAERVARTVRDAAANVRANQWRQPKGAGK
jgi:uncharacterized protein YdeI (YjbR/CyaY-like superfamily)